MSDENALVITLHRFLLFPNNMYSITFPSFRVPYCPLLLPAEN